MKLGAFSVSLSVKDLAISRDFYQKLGFEVFAGDMSHKYLIMKNGEHLLGLFEGMFEGNVLTFNPGWDQNANALAEFDDVRAIAQQLIDQNIELIDSTDAKASGPAHISLQDPDGNNILIDQHV